MTMTRLFAITLLTFLAFSGDLLAQVLPAVLPARVEDALRFSTTFPVGTARFAGTGGSMSSIGVDHSTMATNPAGIGWNRYNSFQLSPGLAFSSTETTLVGDAATTPMSESVFTPALPSLGIVWAGTTRSLNWPTLNFGISLNRLADFNETIAYSGRGEGGVIDAVVEDLNDDIIDPFRSGLIFDIPGAIQEDDLGFFSDFDLEESVGGQVRREGRVERSGSINELNLTLGGNYQDKVMWGFSLGIPFLNFAEVKVYDEVDDRDEIIFFDDAGFDETLEMNGSGVNFKFGLIGRPTDQLRISAAVHSPTFWSLDEVYFTTLEYNYTDDGQALGGVGLSPRSESVVNLQTPWRFMGGVGYLIGRKGFVSVDVDYQNFGSNKFSFDDFATLDEVTNEDIEASLGGALGLRVGGELNLKPVQLRAGVSYRQLPMTDFRFGEDEAILGFSAGAGYGKGKFFVDFAARYEAQQSFYAPYRTFAFQPQVAETNRTLLTGVLTVGFRGF
jgi:hypothetical protein